MFKQLIAANVFWFSITAAAGTLTNGIWLPNACGNRPDPPIINDSTIDSYNTSVKAFDEWQRTSQAYDDCLVKEANTDSGIIVKMAKAEQEKIKDLLNNLNEQLKAGKAKLEQR